MKKSSLCLMFLAISAFCTFAEDDPVWTVGKNEKGVPTVRIDFRSSRMQNGAPSGWAYRGKAGTPDALFSLVRDPELKTKVLKMTSNQATGVIILDIEDIDLQKYPVMRWKWKAECLPSGADARVKEKDDQGISLYVGCGRFRQTSVSYAWQTETPKGESGKSVYNMIVTTYWKTMRNKSDALNQWFTEECQLAKDIRDTFGDGEIPSGLALTISTNSQYTDSRAVCYLEYIEFSEK